MFLIHQTIQRNNMKIRIKHNQTEIEMEFTSSATKDKFDVMRIITHVISEFQYILNNNKEISNEDICD